MPLLALLSNRTPTYYKNLFVQGPYLDVPQRTKADLFSLSQWATCPDSLSKFEIIIIKIMIMIILLF